MHIHTQLQVQFVAAYTHLGGADTKHEVQAVTLPACLFAVLKRTQLSQVLNHRVQIMVLPKIQPILFASFVFQLLEAFLKWFDLVPVHVDLGFREIHQPLHLIPVRHRIMCRILTQPPVTNPPESTLIRRTHPQSGISLIPRIIRRRISLRDSTISLQTSRPKHALQPTRQLPFTMQQPALPQLKLRPSTLQLTFRILPPGRPGITHRRPRPSITSDPDPQISVKVRLHLSPHPSKQSHRVHRHEIPLMTLPRPRLASNHAKPTTGHIQPGFSQGEVVHEPHLSDGLVSAFYNDQGAAFLEERAPILSPTVMPFRAN